jgi:hypothetical protein
MTSVIPLSLQVVFDPLCLGGALVNGGILPWESFRVRVLPRLITSSFVLILSLCEAIICTI